MCCDLAVLVCCRYCREVSARDFPHDDLRSELVEYALARGRSVAAWRRDDVAGVRRLRSHGRYSVCVCLWLALALALATLLLKSPHKNAK